MPVYIKIIRFVVFVGFTVVYTTTLMAQVITGKVIDAETKQPIEGANIYLNGTYKGTSSNKEGNFTLHTEEHQIPLIISYVGYESKIINHYSDEYFQVSLSRKKNILHEVTIGVTEGMSRADEMAIFLREFIGSTGRDCIISNPDDIYFTYHKKNRELIARADQPLLIHNKLLGYKITYFLSYFNHIPDETMYQGNYFFAEDTTGLAPNEIKKIYRARDEAYFGSRMHFIRSLWADELKENFFDLYITDPANTKFYPDSNRRLYKDIVTTNGAGKAIRLKKEMIIIYLGGKTESSLLDEKELNTSSFIGSNGWFSSDLTWSGEMGVQRVNKLLPFEFEPKKKYR